MTACFCHVTYAFQSESRMASLAKWLSAHLQTKSLWVQVLLQSHSIQCIIQCSIAYLVTHSTLLPHLSTHSTRLSTQSTCLFTRSTCLSTSSTRLSIRLSTHSTCLSTCSICLSTCSTCLAIRLSTCNTRSAICQSFYN